MQRVGDSMKKFDVEKFVCDNNGMFLYDALIKAYNTGVSDFANTIKAETCYTDKLQKYCFDDFVDKLADQLNPLNRKNID